MMQSIIRCAYSEFRASLQPPTVVVKLPPQDNVQRQSATQVEQSSDATKTVKDDDVGRETSKATADPSNTFLTEDVASARYFLHYYRGSRSRIGDGN